MKIAVLSDIHYPTRLREIPDLSDLLVSADQIFILGDIVSSKVLDIIKLLGKPINCVYGNMDETDIVNGYPSHLFLKLMNFKIGLIHGWGAPFGIRKKITQVFKEKPDLILYGHTHQKYDKVENSIRYINPGAFCDGEYCMINIHMDHIDTEFLTWK